MLNFIRASLGEQQKPGGLASICGLFVAWRDENTNTLQATDSRSSIAPGDRYGDAGPGGAGLPGPLKLRGGLPRSSRLGWARFGSGANLTLHAIQAYWTV